MKSIALITFLISAIHSTELHVWNNKGKWQISPVNIEPPNYILNTLLALRCRIRGGYIEEDQSTEERKALVRDMQDKVVLVRDFKKPASDSREDSDLDDCRPSFSANRKREREEESEGSEVPQGESSWEQGPENENEEKAAHLNVDEVASEPRGDQNTERAKAVPIEGDVVAWRGAGTPRSNPPIHST
jgi:hypothetical protein